ncbi:MerR family transcriptional regulator [Stappia sp. ES.058]|uniref:MerR family transcriptional regulator n=1 Tax=Stappia sp. ES.058 TaxID=1881061 RepID=UPI00087B709C|nr:MerR family transcriptional regulator [Stappia sp. ES.058]SDU06429.1 MerR HTH family regulatory protein [Stappia sp. ES.058]
MSTEKSPDAFRTISEVAEDLDLPQHVLRFWETRFSQIRPLKRGGGRRYYRPDDIELLRGIRHLLYGEGYTIKGVQRILKEQGARFVMQVWREDGLPLAALAAQVAGSDDVKAATQGRGSKPAASRHSSSSGRGPDVPLPDAASSDAPAMEGQDADLPRGILPETAEGNEPAQARAGLRLMERLLGERAEAVASGNLSKDDIRRLQATLFELLECKRILDQAR